eukprot:g3211.t1
MLPRIIHKDLKFISCSGQRRYPVCLYRQKISTKSLQRQSVLTTRSFRKRNRTTSLRLCASISHEASTSLSTYNLEFRHRHFLFESFLCELIKHLDEAPVLQSIKITADQVSFHHETVDSDRQYLTDEFDVFMYCKAIPKNPVPGAVQYLTGSVGECCEEDFTMTGNEESQFWGVVVKSSLFPGMEGCYLLRTSKVSAGLHCSCSCTHYSLTKIRTGISLADQYDAAWLA